MSTVIGGHQEERLGHGGGANAQVVKFAAPAFLL
jgi:hypothetical protein